MGFLDFFKKQKVNKVSTRWDELGQYMATFGSFGTDIYASDIVRACVRPLAEFTSKAYCTSSNRSIERTLNERPNLYMNGREFLKKIRTLYEISNTCFIFIRRDDTGLPVGYYPVPYVSYEAVDYKGYLYVRFRFRTGKELTVAWEDLAVLRKDYHRSDIAGDSNDAILSTLNLISVTNKGIENAVKSTANLRGIIKSKQAMLSPEDVKKQQSNFIEDYLNLENEGGIASLDASQEFTPITMNPATTNAAQMKEFREDVYRYFGVNEKIVTGDMNSDEVETFYEIHIEPFLCDLSTELETKSFTARQLGYENFLLYEANKIQFASLSKKIQLWSSVVLYGGMTINEWRDACNMPPIEGGDELIRRLDADTVNTPDGEDEENESD